MTILKTVIALYCLYHLSEARKLLTKSKAKIIYKTNRNIKLTLKTLTHQ